MSQPVYPPFIPTIHAGPPGAVSPPPPNNQLYFDRTPTPYNAWVWDPVTTVWEQYGGGGGSCSGTSGDFFFDSTGTCITSSFLSTDGNGLFLSSFQTEIIDLSDNASGLTQQAGTLVLSEAGSINLYGPAINVSTNPTGASPSQGSQCTGIGSTNFIVINGIITDCGTGGFAAVTGSPISGNLAAFSGASSISNSDLSGDCTTTGTLFLTCHLFNSTTKGLVPASGGSSTSLFLNQAGTFTAAAGGVTWPANGSAVISNTTNSPAGIAEVDSKVLVGISGAWVAGNVPLATVTGALCTATNFSIQFDNTGAAGCAPAIVNSGIWDFTPSGTAVLQIAGVNWLVQPFANFMCIGQLACANVSSNNGPMTCIGVAACGNVTSDGGDYTALGNQSCGDVGASGGANNVCIGFQAGKSMAGANSHNTYVGSQSGVSANAGFDTCVGGGTCTNSGGLNTALGESAGGSFNSSASSNTLLGRSAGSTITSGSANICIGRASCPGLTTGSRDIFIDANGSGTTCAMSGVGVNDEFDLCGNSSSDTTPIIRCNIPSIALGNCAFNVPVKAPGYTVSTLPAGPPTGSQAYVTDAVACTFLGTLTGSGSAFCPVIYNGTAWVAS